MARRLAGKACVITGTGGSMGRAAALTFAREGASVVGCEVSVEPAEETVKMVHAAGGVMVSLQPPESRVAMTSDLLIALYVGLSVPVIGAGVALDLGASAPDTVLVFAILVGLGVAVTGWALLGRRGSQVHP